MAARYVLIDTNALSREEALGRRAFPAFAQAGRFSSLSRALRELRASRPQGRFILVDRETGQEVTL